MECQDNLGFNSYLTFKLNPFKGPGHPFAWLIWNVVYHPIFIFTQICNKMIFIKHFDKKKEKKNILTKVKQSTSPIGMWQQKTLMGRLVLVPQYFLAYNMFFVLLFLRYTTNLRLVVILKTHGVLVFLPFIIGFYGDGTTYTETVCFVYFLGMMSSFTPSSTAQKGCSGSMTWWAKSVGDRYCLTCKGW